MVTLLCFSLKIYNSVLMIVQVIFNSLAVNIVAGSKSRSVFVLDAENSDLNILMF